jgi:hypothetical protein
VLEQVAVSWVVSGAPGGGGQAGDTEFGGFGAAGADLVHLGQFSVAGEADLEPLGLAVPAVGLGFGEEAQVGLVFSYGDLGEPGGFVADGG